MDTYFFIISVNFFCSTRPFSNCYFTRISNYYLFSLKKTLDTYFFRHECVYIIFGVKKSICLWECRNMLFSIFPLTFGGQKVPLFSKLLHNFEYLWGSKWLSAEAEKWIRLFQFCSNINHKFQLLHTLLRCCCWS